MPQGVNARLLVINTRNDSSWAYFGAGHSLEGAAFVRVVLFHLLVSATHTRTRHERHRSGANLVIAGAAKVYRHSVEQKETSLQPLHRKGSRLVLTV